MSNKFKIIVILGPTSSGKSDLAVSLALRLRSGQAKKTGTGAEIISADSRQVYKGLNIGTGKITKNEMKRVKHHLLDVFSPKKRFTASDFKKLGEKAIEKITFKNKIPIICGGTGFYIDALLGDKEIPEVPENPKLRKELEKKTKEELFKILQKLDPERAKNIDSKNPRRLIRAIEICKAIGKVPPLQSGTLKQKKFEVLKIGIKIPDDELRERINKRLEKRIRIGMISEAKKLHASGSSYKRMRELGLEYGALADFLDKKISKPHSAKATRGKQEMIERLKKEIWHYAKRQITWFKRDRNTMWIPPKIGLIEKEVKKFL